MRTVFIVVTDFVPLSVDGPHVGGTETGTAPRSQMRLVFHATWKALRHGGGDVGV